MKIRNKMGAVVITALMIAALAGCSSANKAVEDGGGMDLPQQLTSSFGNVSNILGSVTDAGTAEKAVPELNAANADLEKLAQAAASASPEIQSSLADVVASQIPGLNAITEKLYAIPGVRALIKPPVDGLLAKFAGF